MPFIFKFLLRSYLFLHKIYTLHQVLCAGFPATCKIRVTNLKSKVDSENKVKAPSVSVLLSRNHRDL